MWWGADALVASIVDVFGDLPPEWESKWEEMKSDAVTRGDPGAGAQTGQLDCRLERQFDDKVDDPELKALLPVIQGLTKLRPSDRISASQARQLMP